MTGPERGYLLLCSTLGDPARKPLTGPQLRTLAERMKSMPKPEEDRALEAEDLLALGCPEWEAGRILTLLEDEALLCRYLEKAKSWDCHPVTKVSPGYPKALKDRLGSDAPGCLWYKGDLSLLDKPLVCLVGSRELEEDNRAFAAAVGAQAARQGWALVSGNARGADKTAQNSALSAGGCVVSVVADDLRRLPLSRSVLYLCEDPFDAGFSAQRALHRNRIIHALGKMVLVAQCRMERGGTWSGTEQNLKKGYSPVFAFDDGSAAFASLRKLGATPVRPEQLRSLKDLRPDAPCFL